jgi:hypothetical protein
MKRDLRHFDTEAAACEHMLPVLVADPTLSSHAVSPLSILAIVPSLLSRPPTFLEQQRFRSFSGVLRLRKNRARLCGRLGHVSLTADPQSGPRLEEYY